MDSVVMIHAEGLTKRFGGVTAVDRISLDVSEGEVFGLLGPNGAGKTTTVRLLCGLISKSGGAATVAGCEIGKESEGSRLRRQIGFLSENVGLYEGSSAYENLEYFGELQETEADRLHRNIERLLRKVDLWEKRDAPVETFSKGMKQRLALARCLVHDPVLLFLDEPTANLDPAAAKMVRETILELKAEKRTIFLNTHNLDEAQRICDRVGILRTQLLSVGTPRDLESKLGARRTVVRLERATEPIAEAVRARFAGRHVEIVGNDLLVDVHDPDTENPEIVRAVVGAGGGVREVTVPTASLEDVYLKLVAEGGSAS